MQFDLKICLPVDMIMQFGYIRSQHCTITHNVYTSSSADKGSDVSQFNKFAQCFYSVIFRDALYLASHLIESALIANVKKI